MNLIKNFLFQSSKTKKIFILIFFIILLLVVVKLVQLGIFCITDPTTPFLKTMLSIQETPSNLEKSKKIVDSKKINFFNYYMYNNRDYVFTISREMVTFTSIINNNYTYWVQINGKYKNFTKEDIESVLYFEIL